MIELINEPLLRKSSFPATLGLLAWSLLICIGNLACAGQRHPFHFYAALISAGECFYYDHGDLPKNRKDIAGLLKQMDPKDGLLDDEEITYSIRPVIGKEANPELYKYLTVHVRRPSETEDHTYEALSLLSKRGSFWHVQTSEIPRGTPVFIEDPENYASLVAYRVRDLVKSGDARIAHLDEKAVSVGEITSWLSYDGDASPRSSPLGRTATFRMANVDGRKWIVVALPQVAKEYWFDIQHANDPHNMYSRTMKPVHVHVRSAS